jgi:hypothetical protein
MTTAPYEPGPTVAAARNADLDPGGSGGSGGREATDCAPALAGLPDARAVIASSARSTQVIRRDSTIVPLSIERAGADRPIRVRAVALLVSASAGSFERFIALSFRGGR